jgi:hypothetical protein
MEILEAYDLTGSCRDAAELARCSQHTVARYVAAREAGRTVDRAAARPQLIDEFLPKLEECNGMGQSIDNRRLALVGSPTTLS